MDRANQEVLEDDSGSSEDSSYSQGNDDKPHVFSPK
jgi:hypothetical protein